jgi:hypothetical protein
MKCYEEKRKIISSPNSFNIVQQYACNDQEEEEPYVVPSSVAGQQASYTHT